MTDSTLLAAVDSGLAEIKSHTERRFASLQSQLTDLAQKQAPAVPGLMGGTGSGSGLARALSNCPELASWIGGEGRLPNRVKLTFDLVAERKNTTVNSGNTMAPFDREPGIVPLATRRRWLWEYLVNGGMSGPAVEFLTENGNIRVAGVQPAEGQQKPEADFTYELKTSPAVTVAHYTQASRQVLADQPVLQQFLRERLMNGIWLKLEDLMLNGNGMAGSFEGLLAAGNHTIYTPVASTAPVDQIRRAISVLQQADYSPTVIVLNHADWAAIEQKRNTDGHYDFADPRVSQSPQLWGLPIHATNSIAAGKFIVMDGGAATLWTRQQAEVLVGEQHASNFTANIVVLLAEARFAFGVTQPRAVLAGNLASA